MADIQAFVVITVLIWAAVGVYGTTTELSTTSGDTANIPCLFREGTVQNMFWYFKTCTTGHKIVFFVKEELTFGAEYANRTSLQKDNSTLILRNITVADEGTYCCIVDRQGQRPEQNINTKLNVFSLRPDTLPKITPCSQVDESSSCTIHRKQSFTLTCTLPNVYPVEDTELIWYQDGKRVLSTDNITQNDDGTTDISRQIQVSKTGNFTCNATYISANGRDNTAISVEAWIMLPVDVPTPSGKNLTKGQIAGITIGLLVGIFLVTMALVIYRRKRRGFRPVPKDDPLNTQPGLLLSTDDFDDTLVAVAKRVRKDAEIDTLGKKLKFSPEDIQGYIQTNQKTQDVTYDGTLRMLRDWRKNQRGSTERGDLKTALEQSGQTRLADERFPSSQ